MQMPAHLLTNNGVLSENVQWFSHWKMEQMIMTLLCDVMRISHARQGREVYKEYMTRSWGCCYCHLGCLGTRHLGSLISHRPATLGVSVLLTEEAYPEQTFLLVYPYACIQTLLEYNFSCLKATREITTFSP